MTVSIYDLTVTTYLQTLGASGRFLDKGLTHFREHDLDPEQIVETRVFPDMLPFRFQILSIVHHSVGALAALKNGAFKPPGDRTPHNYQALQAIVQDAQEKLQKLTPDEVNAFDGTELLFQAGEQTFRFTAQDFLLSFSLPNFHFHAATAYDILRSKGVPLGKRDYLGKLRFKR
jgi:hypothetical protein